MARLGFILLLVLHALIHLLGFVKEFHLTTQHLLTGKTSVPLSPAQAKAAGIAWLVACLLFAIAALLYLLRKESWWLWFAGAILLSQCLIFLYWQDAKYGTLANGLLLVVTVVAYGQWQFSQMVQAEKGPFMTAPAEPADPLSPNQVAHLPAPVQRWLHRSNVVGKQPLQTAYLQQQGQLRTSPDGAWMPVQAEQFFTVDTPGFLWVAQVQAAPMVHLAGRDKYYRGKGHMLIKLLSLYPVADAQGPKIDQGTLLRYLAEMVWFPSAAVSPYLSWKPVDDTHAAVTMTYAGVTATGTFTYSPAGDVTRFEALRYYDRPTGPTLEKWVVTVPENGYQTFQGIRIPAHAAITWKLKTGDFPWYQIQITGAAFNKNWHQQHP